MKPSRKLQLNRLSKLFFLAFAIALSFLLACTSETPVQRFQRLKSQALSYIEQDKPEEARISLLSAVSAKPDEAEGYFHLADVYVRLKQLPKAVQAYRDTIDLDPVNVEAHLRLGALLLAARELELAESHIFKVREIDPERQEATVLEANLYAARGDGDKAKSILLSVLEDDPENSIAMANLGDIAFNEGNIAQAEEFFLKAIKVAPENGPVRLALANLYIRDGRLDDAQEILQSLVEQNPNDTGLRYFFGEFLLSRGTAEKALTQYQEALEDDASLYKVRDRLYDLYLSRGKLKEAKELTASLISALPKDSAVGYFKGRNLELEAKPEQALEQFIQSFQALNNFAPAFRRAGLIELKLGKTSEGLEHLNQAIAIDSFDVGARLSLARRAFLTKELGAAKEHVEKVLNRFPRQIGANILRADIALIEGEAERARKIYNVLLEAFPTSPVGFNKLALLEEQQGNKEKAMEHYRKALSFDRNVYVPLRRFTSLLVKTQGKDVAFKEVKAFKAKSPNSQAAYDTTLGHLIISDPEKGEERFAEAKKYFTEAIEKDQSMLPAYFALAAIEARGGDLESAEKSYQGLLDVQPKNVSALMLLALTRESKKDYKKAEEAYKQLLSFKPRFGPAANNLAWIMVEHLDADLDEALRLALVAKEELPREGSVADTLGWIYHRRGLSRAAMPILQEAVELEQKSAEDGSVNPEILYHLGVVLESLGEETRAKEVLKQALEKGGQRFSKLEETQQLLNKLN